MMAKAKRDGGSVKISQWNLDTLENLTDILKKAMGAAVDEAVELTLGETAECSLHGDKFTIWLPLGEYSDNCEGPQYDLSLTAVVEEEISLCDARFPEDRETLVKLRDILRALVDKIDAALT